MNKKSNMSTNNNIYESKERGQRESIYSELLPKTSNYINESCTNNIKGVFRIGGQRNFTIPVEKNDLVLVCKRFWNEECFAISVTEDGVNLLEFFTIIITQSFLDKMRNNYFHINLTTNDPVYSDIGVLRLPLHQFFIAYRDESITNRLCEDKFPVISTDTWLPILNVSTGERVGEIECLLAIGTDQQIENIKQSRRWKSKQAIIRRHFAMDHFKAVFNNIQPCINERIKYEENPLFANANLKNNETSELQNMLQKSLTAKPSRELFAQPVELSKDGSIGVQTFQIYLEVQSARGLPTNPSLPMNKKLKRHTTNKGIHLRFPPSEEPNAYVTFQADDGNEPLVKSHEGMVYSTSVIRKSCNPIWEKSFHIYVSSDYLINKKKRFILKIWKKGNTDNSTFLPCPMEDSIIGFSSIDLTVFLNNHPFISGYFNIVDFGGHINGQIKVMAQPLDDLKKLVNLIQNRSDNQVESLLDSFESCLDINNTNLTRAIKRKFTELEGISQRLRARLLDVTGVAVPDADVATEISDDQLDEFEHDINTTSYEDEHEMDKLSSQANSQ